MWDRKNVYMCGDAFYRDKYSIGKGKQFAAGKDIKVYRLTEVETVKNNELQDYLNRSSHKFYRYNNIGGVYLVKSGGLYKVGMSKNIGSRLLGISNSLPGNLEVVSCITACEQLRIEKHFHEKFDGKRVKGEWFDLDDNDIEYFKSFNKDD